MIAKVLCGLFSVFMMSGVSSAEEAKLGRDDFLTTAISDTVEKVNSVATGETRIISNDARGMSPAEKADRDPMGRKVPPPPKKTGMDAALNEKL